MAGQKRPDRRLVDRQHGLVTRQQLIVHGWSRAAIAHRVEIGRLHPIHRGVYAVGHPRLSQEGIWMAAVLACGSGAVLSHASAAALWRMCPVSGPIVDVSVPKRAGRKRRRGIRTHRPHQLIPITKRHNIPVTTPERTVLDFAASAAPRQVERALGEGEYLRLISHERLRSLMRDSPLPPRARRLMSEVLDKRGVGSSMTRSELEARFLELCLANGFPAPRVNTRVHGLIVDFLWPDHRLIVETDGRQSHATSAAFERDRSRDQRLTVAGYRVVRFSYRQVIEDAEGTARVLASLLSEGAGRV